MKDDDESDREAGAEREDAETARVDRMVSDELVRRGELVPTTVGEVLAAEEDGVEYEGELPASLRELAAPKPHGTSDAVRKLETRSERRERQAAEAARIDASTDAGSQRGEPSAPSQRGGAGAASHRVVSLDEVRRERAQARGGWGGYAATFGLGAAAAAAALLVMRPTDTPTTPDRPAAGTPSSSAVTSPEDPPVAAIAFPAVNVCGTSCCAGSSCAEAKGELRRCASGRTCVACEEGAAPTSAFRVRIGNLIPAKGVDPDQATKMDICARVGGGGWSCEPAIADAATRPRGRVLPGAVSSAHLATAIELEVRPKGAKEVLGRWRESVRVGPTVLCRGVGALLANELAGVKTDVGSLSIDLDPTHWVELARGADAAALREARGKLAFADVVPALVEIAGGNGGGVADRFALAVGPLDAAVAERLRWALLEKGQTATVVLGGDYRGEPQKLPETTPPPR